MTRLLQMKKYCCFSFFISLNLNLLGRISDSFHFKMDISYFHLQKDTFYLYNLIFCQIIFGFKRLHDIILNFILVTVLVMNSFYFFNLYFCSILAKNCFEKIDHLKILYTLSLQLHYLKFAHFINEMYFFFFCSLFNLDYRAFKLRFDLILHKRFYFSFWF